MDYKEYRKMKVYEHSGYNYNNIPTIVLKGKWLEEELGFLRGDKVSVKCEVGRLLIIKADKNEMEINSML